MRAIRLAIGYFVCAALTLQLTRFGNGVAVVWLSGALLLATLLATPKRNWSLLVAACLPASIIASASFGIGGRFTLPLACVSMAEAYGAAWLLKRIYPRIGRFTTAGEVLRFIAVAGVMAPGGGALIGAWCANAARNVPYWPAWRDWYAGHALGFITIAPPILLSLRGEAEEWRRVARSLASVEAAALIIAVISCMALTFLQSKVPLVMLPFIPMIYATFRLGDLGALISITALVVIGLTCSLLGLGPTALVPGGMSLKIQILQIYLATGVLILLPIAAELKARRRLLDRFRIADELHRLILDSTSDVILRVGSDGMLRYVSPMVRYAWGYHPAEIINQPGTDFLLEEDVASVLEARQRALGTPQDTVLAEYRIKRKSGEAIWVESHIRATLNEQGHPTGTVSIIREITQRRRFVEDLAKQAATDPLTSVANRRTFNVAISELMQESMDRGMSGCLAVFDLDHFKGVNDRLGHAAGDTVLVRFAAVLRSVVRDGDTVARLGGEEFAVLLKGASTEQALAICERVRSRLSSNSEWIDAQIPMLVTVSVGIAPLLAGTTPTHAMSAADAALYKAKNAGRDKIEVAGSTKAKVRTGQGG